MNFEEAKILYPNIKIHDIKVENDSIIVSGKSSVKDCECPVCGMKSSRLCRYWDRKLQDIPYQKKAVFLEFRIKMIYCDNPECSRKVFTELLPFAKNAQKKTTRLLDLIIEKTRGNSYRKAALELIESGIVLNDSTANKIEKRDRRKGQQ